MYIYIHTSICIYKYIQTYVYIYISNCSKFKVDVTKCISGFALVYTYTPNVQNLKIGLNKTKAFKLLYIYSFFQFRSMNLQYIDMYAMYIYIYIYKHM